MLYYVSRETWLGNSKKTNQDSTFSHIRENSKIFNTNSKLFSFFNNKTPASWVAHITRNLFTCYSCSSYSSMVWVKNLFLTEMDIENRKSDYQIAFIATQICTGIYREVQEISWVKFRRTHTKFHLQVEVQLIFHVFMI